MSWEPQRFKDLHQIPREEHVFPGAPLCAGCGGLESLRLASKVLGPHVVYVNAAGCFTNLATFPFTPLDASWLYTTMGSAPAGAQGVRDALDVLIAKGRLPKEEDVTVVVVGGDGATYDMALSSTSGAIAVNSATTPARISSLFTIPISSRSAIGPRAAAAAG